MFLGVGWGGVITFTYLRTPMMLRHGTFTCTCAHTSCYVKDVSRHAGVGWGGVGNNVHVLAHSHDTPRTIAHIRHATLKMCDVTQGWGGVGWGNNVHVLAHSHDITPRHVHLHVRTYVMLRWRCVTSRRGGVGWGGVGNNVHVLAHSHDTPRHVHLHVRTIAHIRHATSKMCHVTQGWGGVGWGGVIKFTYLPVFPISWHLAQKTNKNWMTSFGRTFADGSGDGRQM